MVDLRLATGTVLRASDPSIARVVETHVLPEGIDSTADTHVVMRAMASPRAVPCVGVPCVVVFRDTLGAIVMRATPEFVPPWRETARDLLAWCVRRF